MACRNLLLSVSLAILSSLQTASAWDSSLKLRCSWTDPVDQSALCFDFGSAPLIVAQPKSSLRCSVMQEKTNLPIVAVEMGSETFPVEPPSEGVEIITPEGTGQKSLAVVCMANGAKVRLAFACFGPIRSEMSSKKAPWRLSAGGEDLGFYYDPRACRVRKVSENAADYELPVFFVRMAEQNANLLLTPRIRVSDMLIPDEKTGELPGQVFPINYRFLSNRETLYDVLWAKKLPVQNMRFLSSFRSSAHNREVGSSAFSRHPYGDAFDLFFDGNNDGAEDDLTGDGKVTREDAMALIDAVEEAQKSGKLDMGGIGVYDWTRGGNTHILTFHLDFRGHRARWWNIYGRRISDYEWPSKYFAAEDAAEKQRKIAEAARGK